MWLLVQVCLLLLGLFSILMIIALVVLYLLILISGLLFAGLVLGLLIACFWCFRCFRFVDVCCVFKLLGCLMPYFPHDFGAVFCGYSLFTVVLLDEFLCLLQLI